MDNIRNEVIDCCKKMHFEAARTLCAKSISSSHTSQEKARVLVWLSYVEAQSGNQEGRLKALLQGKTIDPNNKAILFCLTQFYYEDLQYRQCLLLTKQLISAEKNLDSQPFSNNAFFYQALSYIGLGNKVKAIDAIDQCSAEHEELLDRNFLTVENVRIMISKI